MCIYPIGETDACRCAAQILKKQGLPETDHPSPDVTHLLLDIPSFRSDGQLRCGGEMQPLLRMLPPNICIIGGNLETPVLENYRKIDLLKDEMYLARNAAITADCALRLAGSKINTTFSDSKALVIGWGRIGKCLAQLLRSIGCAVTVAARKESDRAMLHALGYESIAIEEIPKYLKRYSLLFNTVPYPIINTPIPSDCLAFELASTSGIPVDQTIDARGLPGKLAPVSSGRLIAETILHFIQEE